MAKDDPTLPGGDLDEGGQEGAQAVEGARAPAGELARWRARALEAERRAAALEEELSGAREALRASERGREIDALLRDAGAVDLETARLLTEASVAQMDEADAALAVDELRAAKPFLFAPAAQRAGLAARLGDAGEDPLDEAAAEAAATGDRGALLRYLRLRRRR